MAASIKSVHIRFLYLHLNSLLRSYIVIYPEADGRIILKWILRKQMLGMDWIKLAQDSDRWQALVNAVMNVRVPKNAGNFLIS
jgi:hypothetical protein